MKKKAFTLAEVLITLTIIGVIAALTIPNLMNKYDKHISEVKIQKAYSLIANSFKSKIHEAGCSDIACLLMDNNFSYPLTYSNIERVNVMKLFFKEVELDTEEICVPNDFYDISGNKYDIYPSRLLGNKGLEPYMCINNNMGIAIWNYSFSSSYTSNCVDDSSECIFLAVFTDIGKGKKAIIGKNFFTLSISGTGDIRNKTNINPTVYPDAVIPYLQKHAWQMDYLK